jgi:viroplasmin and RNaseH domain-containing protein
MFVVKNGQFDGIFLDRENAELAVGDYVDAEIKEFKTWQEAIHFLNMIIPKYYAVFNGRICGLFSFALT